MNAFLDSLKSDLLDRRVTPLLALLVAAVLGAIVYAAIGGGSGSSTPAATGVASTSPSTAGIAVTAVQSDSKSPAAETTSGASEQSGGASRNPFAPTPGATAANKKSATASAESGASASGSSTTPGTTGSSSTGGGSEPSSSQTGGSQQERQPSKHGKQQKTYKVSVLFGTATPGTPVLEAGLTSYDALERQQPLPSTQQPVIVFRGVVVGAKSATFTLVGEAIPHGAAICKPSPEQCQALDLKVGQTEELEYVPLGGAPVNYMLKLVAIEMVSAGSNAKQASLATAARAGAAYGGESRAGVELLRREGLTKLPGLRYSRNGSVLVFVTSHHARAARTHAAAWAATARD